MKVKVKAVLSCVAIFLLTLSAFQLCLPVYGQQGSSSTVGSNAYWLRLAGNAWRFFQPGVGVNAGTGLHSASVGWPYFTGWDLGVYLCAVMDAQQLGLISSDGAWGSDFRVDKVLSFLETMPLTGDNIPYLWYKSDTGLPAFDLSSDATNACDYGALLVALHRLAVLKPDLAGRIGNIVNVRLNTGRLASGVIASQPYDYYVAHGFEYFGYGNYAAISGALGVLNNLEGLPKVLGMVNLGSDSALAKLTWNVYLAHEGRYNATGKFTAFGEGNTGLSSPSYVYEQVVTSNGSSWAIEPYVTPIVYFKVAASFLAYYNTSFARNMVSFLEPRLLTASSGYMDGVDESGRVVSTVIDKTNGMVLDAAWYAIQHSTALTASQSPFPSPSPAGVTPASPSSSLFASPSFSAPASPSLSPYSSASPAKVNPTPSVPASSAVPSSFASESPDQTQGGNVPWILQPLIIGVIVVASVGCVLLLALSRRNRVLGLAKV